MRKRIARRIRKNIMRLGIITEEKVLNRDEDGKLYPKKEWGYTVHAVVNGYRISAPDDSWYEAYKGCYFAARWASEQEPFEDFNKREFCCHMTDDSGNVKATLYDGDAVNKVRNEVCLQDAIQT